MCAKGSGLNPIWAANCWKRRKLRMPVASLGVLLRVLFRNGITRPQHSLKYCCRGCKNVIVFVVDTSVLLTPLTFACGRRSMYLGGDIIVDIATQRQDLGFAPKTVAWHETLTAVKFLAQQNVLYFVSSLHSVIKQTYCSSANIDFLMTVPIMNDNIYVAFIYLQVSRITV